VKTNEYIICAANWYKDLELKKNDFPSTHLRPKNIVSGIVFTGRSHLRCLYQVVAMTGLKQAEHGDFVEGFITSEDRFVERAEAAQIALASGQIKKLQYSSTDLYSEDLLEEIQFVKIAPVIRVVDFDGMGGKEYIYHCGNCKAEQGKGGYCSYCGSKYGELQIKDTWGI
jgi:hypothetical protein